MFAGFRDDIDIFSHCLSHEDQWWNVRMLVVKFSEGFGLPVEPCPQRTVAIFLHPEMPKLDIGVEIDRTFTTPPVLAEQIALIEYTGLPGRVVEEHPCPMALRAIPVAEFQIRALHDDAG